MLASRGIRYLLHYLDDFLFLAAPNSFEGSDTLSTALETLHFLGIPVAANKTEGPTTSLVFLGIHMTLTGLSYGYTLRQACQPHHLNTGMGREKNMH